VRRSPAGLSEQERASFEILRTSGMNRNLAYVTMMGARPQAVGIVNLTTDTQFPGIFLDTHVPKYKELADR
jgi:hypothetical protein